MVAPKGSNNRTVILILAGAAGLILLLGCVFSLVLISSLGDSTAPGKGGNNKVVRQTFPTGDDASTLKPEQVVKAFLQDLREERLEDAYQRTSTGFQGSQSQNDFNTFVRKNKALIGHVTWRHTLTGQTADGGKVYKGNVGGGLEGSTDFTLEIGPEDQGWRVRKFTCP